MNNDRAELDRIVAIGLATIGVSCVLSIAVIGFQGRDIPAALVGIGSAVAGALAGALYVPAKNLGDRNGTKP